MKNMNMPIVSENCKILFPRKYDEMLLNSSSYKIPQAAIIRTEINSTG